MRNLLVLCTAIAVSLLGACVSFDPSGQPMNDDVVDPAPEVDAGVATAPDAEATPPPVDTAPVDAAPADPPDPPDDDHSGPGGGGGPGPGGPGGGDD